MKLCVSSYSFAQYLRAGKMNLTDCVKKAREMGFDAIEFTDLPGKTAEERAPMARSLRKEAADAGIEILAYSVWGQLYQPTPELLEDEIRRLMEQADTAAELGAAIMRHDVLWNLPEDASFSAILPAIADASRRIAAYAKTRGIVTCTENHGMIVQGSERMEQLYHAVKHDNYRLLIDIGNFTAVSEDHAGAVERLAPYAVHVHIKDHIIRDQPFEDCKPRPNGLFTRAIAAGEGSIPIKKCIEILLSTGYDGALAIEYEAADDCMDGIARGLSNLRRMLAEVRS